MQRVKKKNVSTDTGCLEYASSPLCDLTTIWCCTEKYSASQPGLDEYEVCLKCLLAIIRLQTAAILILWKYEVCLKCLWYTTVFLFYLLTFLFLKKKQHHSSISICWRGRPYTLWADKAALLSSQNSVGRILVSLSVQLACRWGWHGSWGCWTRPKLNGKQQLQDWLQMINRC